MILLHLINTKNAAFSNRVVDLKKKNVVVCTYCEPTLKGAWFVLHVRESPTLVFINRALDVWTSYSLIHCFLISPSK